MKRKTTGRLRLPMISATAAIAFAIAGLVSAGAAFANHTVTLNEDWAPFNRCPVDNPAMLAADGSKTEAICLADHAPGGSLRIGNLSVATGAIDHQFGLILKEEEEGSTVVAPSEGVLLDEPIELPGGIQELICPNPGEAVWHVCQNTHHHGYDRRVDAVTLTLESAGLPTEFSLFGGLVEGVPFLKVPAKIHVENDLMGDHCYIGTDKEPIILQPMNLSQPAGHFALMKPNGTPLGEGEEAAGELLTIGAMATQGANAFTVPPASGCGYRGFLDGAIDNKVGLPSSASTNSLVFNEATSGLVGIAFPEAVAPNDGKELSKDWHSAVVPPAKSGHGHGHQNWNHWSRGYIEEGVRHWFRHRH